MLLRRDALLTSWTSTVPPLRNGDHLSQPEFHRRYEQYPEDAKFELIKGMVHMASPEGLPHSVYVVRLGGVLATYEAETPGVEAALLAGDLQRLLRTARKGLAYSEHARFIARLAKAAKTAAQRQKRTRKNDK